MDFDNCFDIEWDNMCMLLSVFQEVIVSDKDVFWEGGEIIDGYDIIFSYMLKNCLFCVVNDLKDVDKSMG